MISNFRYFCALIIAFPLFCFSQTKYTIENNRIVTNENLKYTASWGFLTIGSATTKVDKNIYKIGSNYCYKIDIEGQTNGLARLFYVHDHWISFIDTATITTNRSFRSIREGRYELDEIVHFDQKNKNAEVKVYDKKQKKYVLKKNYKTPENIRDVVAGFMVIRLIDLSKYKTGDVFTINGFYEDEGYSIDVVFQGKEIIKTGVGNMLCYKVNPVVPKNKVFNGRNSVEVWLAANRAQTIMRIKARMFVGNIVVELDD